MRVNLKTTIPEWMINMAKYSKEERAELIELINSAIENGKSLNSCLTELGISKRTWYVWTGKKSWTKPRLEITNLEEKLESLDKAHNYINAKFKTIPQTMRILTGDSR